MTGLQGREAERQAAADRQTSPSDRDARSRATSGRGLGIVGYMQSLGVIGRNRRVRGSQSQMLPTKDQRIV